MKSEKAEIEQTIHLGSTEEGANGKEARGAGLVLCTRFAELSA
jgi:hypothetical protein